MFDREKLNQLYRYGVSLTANEQLAWDLVHDSVEKLISKTFILNKMSYAKTTMRNQFYDILKSKANTTTGPLGDEEPFSEGDIDSNLDSISLVNKLMQKLSPTDRELLYLWAVEEYTTKEISILMSIPKGSVTSKLKRLREKLQSKLGEKG